MERRKAMDRSKMQGSAGMQPPRERKNAAPKIPKRKSVPKTKVKEEKKRKSTYKRKTMTWKEKVYLQGYRKAIENFKLELLGMVDDEDFITNAQKRATIIINASKRVETMADKAKEELKEKLKE